MALGKVIFIDSVHHVLWDRLTEMGWECEDFTKITPAEIIPELPKFDGIVIRSKFKLTKDILSSLSKLKFIARAGSGLENIDLEFCESEKIQVFSSPEGNRDAVAEHITGMLLMLRHNLKRADVEVRKGIWKRAENRGYELKGKTIALIGYGVMGKAFAQRLSGFEMNVIAYDKFKRNFSDELVKEVSLNEVFESADIISLHTNYLPENKYLFNKDFINRLAKPIVVINSARGFNVNTNDLVEGLKSGKIIGACLDVLEYESISFENIPDESTSEAFKYLLNSENVLLSPHIAGWTHESHFKLSNILADKIEDWMSSN